MSLFGSMRGTAWVVWCPDLGSTKEDGKRIFAYSAESAAKDWAEWSDSSSADYSIVGGSPAEVVVAEDRNGAPEYRFTVSGESCPVYRARSIQTASGSIRSAGSDEQGGS